MPSEGAPGGPILDALRDPRYRQLWLSGVCANTVRAMDLVVLGWVALTLTDSPFMLGVAAFCRSVPMIALGPFAGLVADRVRSGRVMVAVQALNVATTGALALLFGLGRGGFLLLVLLAILLGIGWVADFPARRTAMYAIVGRERLANAVSLDNASAQGTKIVGPLAAGVVLARFGPAAAYGMLAALSGVALLLVRGLDRQVSRPAAPRDRSVLASLADGVRDVRAQPLIRGVLLVTVIMNTLVFPYQQMLPVFARDVLRVGPERLGLLVAAEGLGALGGALVFATGRGLASHARVFVGGSALTALFLVGFALSPWYALSVLVQVAIGVGEAGFANMQSTIVLLQAPEATRGRSLGILSACIGTQPFGTLGTGVLTGWLGAPAATAGLAAVALALMAPVGARMTAPDAGRRAWRRW